MTAHRSMIRRAAAVAAAGAAAVVLAACGGGDDNSSGHSGHDKSPPPTASASARQGDHNAADVSFAKGMIPHHRQAIEMADLAESRAGSAEVKTLAAEIRKAQDPEIKTLSGWLTSWGEEVPEEGEGGEHAGHSMSGMMTAEEMAELEKASGEAFDTAFLEMMVEHHEGAVEMARTEQSDGSYQPAKDMAGDIIASQSAEITRMNELLRKN
ncbi:DUF305 domain-containing protein [Streptomyces sp. PKU-EA00015]|uniref:DUF305 domain-containing protein n=1 Tax=Streptomyces sp. PKU-EA00015 TaxID=2748326 RepID=UPI0015A2F5A5|nr:DUF305 domain-containing protein [Streptomyces sp. PKU-EA00015]NWF30394.1 DUF305 domain-containing protein [Streptomyces sp. PKU-EA00015]